MPDQVRKGTNMKLNKDKIAATTGAEVVATAGNGAAVAAKAPKEVTKILTPGELKLLRDVYDPKVFLGAAPRMIRYFKAGGMTNWLGQTVFNPIAVKPKGSSDAEEELAKVKNAETSGSAAQTTLTPAFREAVVLSVLATTQRDPVSMAAHIYWALMEGLSVENIADVFMTVGAYAGIDNLRFTTSLLADVLTFLQEFIKEGKTKTGEVLFRLNAIYISDPVAKGRAAALLPDPPPNPAAATGAGNS
jgi:alkylhydroperoxidase/carboxymuconolactone decarboxylase family protein YurZ